MKNLDTEKLAKMVANKIKGLSVLDLVRMYSKIDDDNFKDIIDDYIDSKGTSYKTSFYSALARLNLNS